LGIHSGAARKWLSEKGCKMAMSRKRWKNRF
jgi:hypothetical protein